MKYRLIDEEKSHHTISRICRALGVTRAGYHAYKTRPASRRSLEDAHLKELIEKAYADSHQTYGAPRIHAELVLAYGISISRKRVARLMRELDIIGVSRRKTRGRPRRLAPETPAAPDLVRRDFSATAPNELWVADITYVPTWEGWLFLAVVTDVFTKRIVGWSMRDDICADIVVDALGMAATMQQPGPELVHHSDRGAQYRSLALGKTLRETGIMQSMGSRGDAYDNAEAESVMSTIKNELVNRHRFKTRDEARLAVFSFIEGFYNPHRRHSSLGYRSPMEYEKMWAEDAELAASVRS
jgi:putative transposase